MKQTAPATLVDQLVATCTTADGIFAVGPDQRITHWGATAEQILRRPAGAALNHSCQEIIGGRDARNARFCRKNCPIMRNAQKGRPTPNYDILVQAGDGTQKWLNVTLLVVNDPERRSMSVVHLFRDVTKRRQLEEKARRAMLALRRSTAEPPPAHPAMTEPGPAPAAGREATPQLTQRELETLRLLAMGLSTEQIAESLGVSRITARNHITNLQTKLGAKTRLQAVLYASQQNIL